MILSSCVVSLCVFVAIVGLCGGWLFKFICHYFNFILLNKD